MEVVREVEYFGNKVTVEKQVAYGEDIFTFEITCPDGKTHTYAGSPNQVFTLKGALKRAWYRCKWMADGSYNKRYR